MNSRVRETKWRIVIRAALAAGLVFAVIANHGMFGKLDFGGLAVFPAFLLLLLSIGLAGTATVIHCRERRVRRLVPAHNGSVCPNCLLLIVADAGDSKLLACPCGQKPYEEHELQDLWQVYPRRFSTRDSWMRYMDPPDSEKLSRTQKFMRQNQWAMLGWFALMGLMQGAIFFVIDSEHLVVAFIHMTNSVLLFFGMGCLALGIGWRTGRVEYCAACGYRKISTAADLCPECGAKWGNPGGTQIGRKIRRPVWIWIGAASLALGLGGMISSFQPSARTLRFVTTSALIASVTGNQDAVHSKDWKELTARQLTASQRDSLARGLLKILVNEGPEEMLDYPGRNWLAAQVDANALSPDVIDEFHSSMFQPQAVHYHDSGGTAQRDIAFEIKHHPFLTYETANKALIVIDGVYLDDDPESIVTSDENRQVLIGLFALWMMLDPQSDQQPYDHLGALAPGEHRIRLDAWYAFGPETLFQQPVRRDPSGRPLFPASVKYSRPFTMEESFVIPD